MLFVLKKHEELDLNQNCLLLLWISYCLFLSSLSKTVRRASHEANPGSGPVLVIQKLLVPRIKLKLK